MVESGTHQVPKEIRVTDPEARADLQRARRSYDSLAAQHEITKANLETLREQIHSLRNGGGGQPPQGGEATATKTTTAEGDVTITIKARYVRVAKVGLGACLLMVMYSLASMAGLNLSWGAQPAQLPGSYAGLVEFEQDRLFLLLSTASEEAQVRAAILEQQGWTPLVPKPPPQPMPEVLFVDWSAVDRELAGLESEARAIRDRFNPLVLDSERQTLTGHLQRVNELRGRLDQVRQAYDGAIAPGSSGGP